MPVAPAFFPSIEIEPTLSSLLIASLAIDSPETRGSPTATGGMGAPCFTKEGAFFARFHSSSA